MPSTARNAASMSCPGDIGRARTGPPSAQTLFLYAAWHRWAPMFASFRTRRCFFFPGAVPAACLWAAGLVLRPTGLDGGGGAVAMPWTCGNWREISPGPVQCARYAKAQSPDRHLTGTAWISTFTLPCFAPGPPANKDRGRRRANTCCLGQSQSIDGSCTPLSFGVSCFNSVTGDELGRFRRDGWTLEDPAEVR